MREGFFVAFAQEKVLRVWNQLKRFFFESKKIVIHLTRSLMLYHDHIALFDLTIFLLPVILSANSNNSHDLLILHMQGFFWIFQLECESLSARGSLE
jgi:hypothetical protein